MELKRWIIRVGLGLTGVFGLIYFNDLTDHSGSNDDRAPKESPLSEIDRKIDQPGKSDIETSTTKSKKQELQELSQEEKDSYRHTIQSIDIHSPEGKSRLSNDLSKLTPSQLSKLWPIVGRNSDSVEFQIFISSFGYQLGKNADMEVYSNLAALIANPLAPISEKFAAISVLGYAASPYSIDILTRYLQSANRDVGTGESQSHLVEQKARDAINLASKTLIDGARNWAIAPNLEAAWYLIEPTVDNRQTLVAIGQSIAFLGRPEGVTALISAALKGSPQNYKTDIALAALTRVKGNDSVEILSENLLQNKGNPSLAQAIALGLLSIGTPDAYAVLENFVKTRQHSNEEWFKLVEKNIEQQPKRK